MSSYSDDDFEEVINEFKEDYLHVGEHICFQISGRRASRLNEALGSEDGWYMFTMSLVVHKTHFLCTLKAIIKQSSEFSIPLELAVQSLDHFEYKFYGTCNDGETWGDLFPGKERSEVLEEIEMIAVKKVLSDNLERVSLVEYENEEEEERKSLEEIHRIQEEDKLKMLQGELEMLQGEFELLHEGDLYEEVSSSRKNVSSSRKNVSSSRKNIPPPPTRRHAPSLISARG